MTKSTSQARIKPYIFANFRSEPGPNQNPSRKARPDLQLCALYLLKRVARLKGPYVRVIAPGQHSTI